MDEIYKCNVKQRSHIEKVEINLYSYFIQTYIYVEREREYEYFTLKVFSHQK